MSVRPTVLFATVVSVVAIAGLVIAFALLNPTPLQTVVMSTVWEVHMRSPRLHPIDTDAHKRVAGKVPHCCGAEANRQASGRRNFEVPI
jgi:hypothetical protein